MVKVKICGITRLEDAIESLKAGADYLGFILYPPSPRAISEQEVARLVTRLRTAMKPFFERPDPPHLIGVFVNRSPDDVASVLTECNLDLAQLSGDEEPRDIFGSSSTLSGRGYKAIRPSSLDEAMSLSRRYTNFDDGMIISRPRLLLDTPHANLYGGTGETGDWSIAAELAKTTPGLMLAGGLHPENVAEAVSAARPFAIDVAGGVEIQPGIKDHDRVYQFIRNAKSA